MNKYHHALKMIAKEAGLNGEAADEFWEVFSNAPPEKIKNAIDIFELNPAYFKDAYNFLKAKKKAIRSGDSAVFEEIITKELGFLKAISQQNQDTIWYNY